MGSNVAPPYANAYMAHFEDTSIYTHELFQNHVLTWKRYIDDVFCIWRGDLDSLQDFFLFLRTAWPGLDFTMTHDPYRISFLDTVVIKDTNGNLSTDLYSKPTDRNSLLHYDSFHPKNMKKSIPKSQLHRVTKIVSDPAIKEQRTSEMKSKFRERGYPPRILDVANTNDTRRVRDSAVSRIPFVHQYHPAAYRLHKTIRQHWHILQTAFPTVKEFQHPFMPCFKRPRNIKDSLVRADIGPIHPGPTQRFLSNPRTGTFPCLNCNQCNNVIKGNIIHHPHTGKRYPINSFFTCDTNFVVYLIKCPCGLLYVESSVLIPRPLPPVTLYGHLHSCLPPSSLERTSIFLSFVERTSHRPLRSSDTCVTIALPLKDASGDTTGYSMELFTHTVPGLEREIVNCPLQDDSDMECTDAQPQLDYNAVPLTEPESDPDETMVPCPERYSTLHGDTEEGAQDIEE
ncbi:unnamed protein product [Ranitomeya imitator]|uniref:Helix-turn-helix domain-containing protein n=1 Tax=Ranitomeya imitator TaxID=111125 RepID=A0ABN9KSB3_9NEOB|nr:unnamed protein product [Ranitomeya imitator]